jgi:ribonucleoside-diphosphate reductase alpha chain
VGKDVATILVKATAGTGSVLTSTFQNQGDAPSCPRCGHIAVRNGACYKCLNCGESLGCS